MILISFLAENDTFEVEGITEKYIQEMHADAVEMMLCYLTALDTKHIFMPFLSSGVFSAQST